MEFEILMAVPPVWLPLAMSAGSALLGGLGGKQSTKSKTSRQTTTKTPPSELGGFGPLQFGFGRAQEMLDPSSFRQVGEGNPFLKMIMPHIMGRATGMPRDELMKLISMGQQEPRTGRYGAPHLGQMDYEMLSKGYLPVIGPDGTIKWERPDIDFSEHDERMEGNI